MSHVPPRAARIALALAIAVGLGCWPGGGLTGPKDDPPPPLSEPELAAFLTEYCAQTASLLETTSIGMQHETDDRLVRRRLTMWKMLVVAECQRAAANDDPVAAFLNTWFMAVRHERMMSSEGPAGGGPVFGDQQPEAIAAADELLARIESVAPRVIPPEHLEQARQGLYALADDQVGGQGVGSLWSGDSTVTALSVLDQPMFGWATGIALSPFRALEGVDEGAQAAHRLADAANRYAVIAEQLPQQLRWQMELLLYDVEDRDTVEVLRETAAQIGDSAERISTTAERLPDELRRSLTLSLEELSDAQSGLGPTLETTRETVEALTTALGALEHATGALDETLLIVRDWPTSEPDPDAPPSRPFDITEYTAALQSAASALAEARSVLDEARVLGTSPALTASAAELDATVRGLVDHVALRLLQVLGVALAAIAVTVVVVRRLGRRPTVAS